MRPGIEARYLDIEWQECGRARRIDVAPEPIEIGDRPDEAMIVETQIFHDLHPWLGLRLSGELAGAEPYFLTPQGDRQPMLPLDDGQDGIWWVKNDGWDDERKRHLSEMHRTAGEFEIAIGSRRLIIENFATGLGKAELTEYLSDFKQDLIWLSMGFGGGAAIAGELSVDARLATALSAFAKAARAVNENPARAMRETQMAARIGRLRPNVATFRQHARTPTAQHLVGRCAEETADISDNRYLRHMVQVCERLARSIGRSAGRRAASFSAWSTLEAERQAAYLKTDSRAVDPDIFDRQQAELQAKLDLITSYSDGTITDPEATVINYGVRIWNTYKNNVCQLLFYKLNPNAAEDKQHNIEFNVLQLPEDLAVPMFAAKGFSRDYTIKGVAKATGLEGRKKYGRLVKFSHVINVIPHTHAIINKQSKRKELENNGWITRLSRQEREEIRKEARTAERRARVYSDQARCAAATAIELSGCKSDLSRQDLNWANAGVLPSPHFPMGMRFSQSPAYAGCLAAFQRVNELAERSGIGEDALASIDRIGVLHASALYERWCLIKIISVLVEDFSFAPPKGWQEQVVRAVTGRIENLTLELVRDDLGLRATLDIQPLLTNGRRPDFRISFSFDSSPTAGRGGLVLDAKFRTRWRPGELDSMLHELIAVKGYDQDGDRVFVLQPAPHSAFQTTSPLSWGKNCDYGHDLKLDHKRGHIHLASGNGAASSQENLRRLIALELQAAFPPPKRSTSAPGRWISNSFCIRCGGEHGSDAVFHKLTKKLEKDYWHLLCTSCEMLTVRTHCFACERTLFKNGTKFTYHKTLADQVTNVVCPNCEECIDPDWASPV